MTDIQHDLYSDFEMSFRGERWDDIKGKVDEFAARYSAETLGKVYSTGFDRVRHLCDNIPRSKFPIFDSQSIARLSYALGLLSHYIEPKEGTEHIAENIPDSQPIKENKPSYPLDFAYPVA